MIVAIDIRNLTPEDKSYLNNIFNENLEYNCNFYTFNIVNKRYLDCSYNLFAIKYDKKISIEELYSMINHKTVIYECWI